MLLCCSMSDVDDRKFNRALPCFRLFVLKLVSSPDSSAAPTKSNQPYYLFYVPLVQLYIIIFFLAVRERCGCM